MCNPDDVTGAVSSGDPDYVGALEQWDATMERVVNVLQDKGVYNDTLIWITSDNGKRATRCHFFFWFICLFFETQGDGWMDSDLSH